MNCYKPVYNWKVAKKKFQIKDIAYIMSSAQTTANMYMYNTLPPGG